ncbi:unnamed protein product [Protopolystoma xenopodis]|uniref:Uncharacterized protein n=1 Tax=Protopolystoma xenopodis TaxID=117903 RepID=A0A448XMN0_9PLAT|nr:unnamed protein product [Protopolystoma xenopodis]
MLKRKSSDLKVSKEKLVLSINVLLSRIGGLCSLSIGLTMAVFVELIEFIYLLFFQCRDHRKQRSHQTSVSLSNEPILCPYVKKKSSTASSKNFPQAHPLIGPKYQVDASKYDAATRTAKEDTSTNGPIGEFEPRDRSHQQLKQEDLNGDKWCSPTKHNQASLKGQRSKVSSASVKNLGGMQAKL